MIGRNKNRAVYSENKENIKLSKQLTSNPVNNTIQKFGKSIRAKALPKYDTTTPLKQIVTKNRTNQPRRSVLLNQQKAFKDDISRLSISFISQIDDNKSEVDDLSNSYYFSKHKNVRFSQFQECEQMSKSRSQRKSSILKNSRFSDKQSSASFNSHVGSISGGMTAKASVKDKGIFCQNSKYQNTLKNLIKNNKKFFDDMFPPGGASLFYTKKQAQKYKDIRWVRPQEIFPGKKIILYNHEDRNTIKSGNFKSLDYMTIALNAIGTSPRCIEKIFEDQKISRHGIYYLRINHGGIWKYVVVDDHIPVKKVGKTYIPLFLNIKPSKSQYYQVWPFLLQKALAKIYSAYEALMDDQFENSLFELTGIIPDTIQVQHMQNDPSIFFKLKNLLLNPDNIIIGKQPNPSKLCPNINFYALKHNSGNQLRCFMDKTKINIIDSFQENQVIDLKQIYKYFDKILLIALDDSYYSVGCIIKQQKGSISLRKFTVQGYGNANLSLIQKDKKFYRNNGYKYAWMRIMLVLKDFDGYRWINGAYGNQKCLNIQNILQPGQYFIIVIGQWDKKVFDITLNYQGNLQIDLVRQNINNYSDIVQQTCRDLSQRFGSFRQLSKNLCSYQFIDFKNGFLIENLNNEIKRQVYYQRKYCLPFVNFRSVGNVHLSVQNQIEGFIDPDCNLTLALMILGGTKDKQIQKFEF